MAQRAWRHILVRATNWLGDAIMSLPALHALRQGFPKARVTILGLPWVKDLYGGESFADDFLVYPKGWKDGAWKAKRHLIAELRARNFDCAILLQNAFEAAAIVRLAGIPERIGYDRDGRGWLLTEAIETPAAHGAHERFYYLELLRRSGLIPAYNEDSPIALGRAAAARAQGLARLAAENIYGPTIGVSPGAAFGSAKRWYPDRFAAVAAALAKERAASVILYGSLEEAPIVAQVEQHLRHAGIPVHNFAARTKLRDFVDLVAAMDLMLTNDSGAMHVAYSVATPSVTIFGPTDHIGTGPVGPHARLVREPVDCSPCKLRECPIDHRCMTRIHPDRVVNAALDLLRAK
jgi:heptosyltransferase-2